MFLQCTLIDMPRTAATTPQDKHARNGSQHFIHLVAVRYAEHGVDARLQGGGFRRCLDFESARQVVVKIDELHGMPSVTGHKF